MYRGLSTCSLVARLAEQHARSVREVSLCKKWIILVDVTGLSLGCRFGVVSNVVRFLSISLGGRRCLWVLVDIVDVCRMAFIVVDGVCC